MRKSLTKLERLGKRSDIKKVFAYGKKINVSGAKLVYLKNNFVFSRFMITLVRSYGNAVQRNKAKRIAREVYRLNKHQIKTGYDIVLVFFPDKDLFIKREEQIIKLLKKAGLYSTKGDTQ